MRFELDALTKHSLIQLEPFAENHGRLAVGGLGDAARGRAWAQDEPLSWP